MADFMGHEDLVDAEDFQEMDQFNPKSKTTNMSSLLKQINQSIKKAGGGKKQKQCKLPAILNSALNLNLSTLLIC